MRDFNRSLGIILGINAYENGVRQPPNPFRVWSIYGNRTQGSRSSNPGLKLANASGVSTAAVIDVLPDDVGATVLLDGDFPDLFVTRAWCFITRIREEHGYGPVWRVVVCDGLAGFSHAELDRVSLHKHFIKLFGEFQRKVSYDLARMPSIKKSDVDELHKNLSSLNESVKRLDNFVSKPPAQTWGKPQALGRKLWDKIHLAVANLRRTISR